MYRIQEPPNAIQVELTEGCSMYCTFCGIRGIRAGRGEFKFMELADASYLAKRIAYSGWTSRIEFGMRGEPSMNPHFIKIIEEFRRILPAHQLMMTSNGSGFIKPGNILKVFDAGLDILALDDYKDGVVSKIMQKNNCDWFAPVYHYPEDPRGNPHKLVKEKFITIIQDISDASKGTHAKLLNHCGCAAPLNQKAQGKRCAKPFREMAIRWDGNVAPCCNDWRGTILCGNAFLSPLDEIWQGRKFNIIRQLLYHGERIIPPCAGCDATGFRLGLLPDKMGKETLPIASYADRQYLQDSITSMTIPVLRDWEK